MIIESLVAALVPAGVEAVKGISRKFVGLSVDDQIKLDNAGIQKLEALAKLDSPSGTPSQWVVDLRASFRYLGAGASIVGGLVGVFTDPANVDIYGQLITIPFSFIFGERMILSLKGK